MQSLRLGKPFTHVEYDDSGTAFLSQGIPRLSSRALDLKGSKIAHTSSNYSERDAVILRDLVTGSMLLFHGHTLHSVIYSLALSTELLAYVTSNAYLHVVKLADPAWSTRHRLPSRHIQALGVDGSTVAVVMDEDGSVWQISHVYLFDAKSHQSKMLSVASGRSVVEREYFTEQSQYSCSVLVDSQKEVVDLFSLVASSHTWPHRINYLEIVHLRVNFAGEIMKFSNFSHVLDDVEVDDNWPMHFPRHSMAPPVPLGHRGLFRIQVGELLSRNLCRPSLSD